MTSTVQHRGSIWGIRPRAMSAALALGLVLLQGLGATRSAQAQTFNVIPASMERTGQIPVQV
jgi:hypothetical protein